MIRFVYILTTLIAAIILDRVSYEIINVAIIFLCLTLEKNIKNYYN